MSNKNKRWTRSGYTTEHVSGGFLIRGSVLIDWDAIQRMGQRAANSKGQKCVDGAVMVKIEERLSRL